MKSILFSTEMVKAILDSKKTMTRRIITKFYDIDCKKPKKCPIDFKDLPKDLEFKEIQGFEKNCALFYSKSKDKYYCSDNLKYHVGDKLWVRETFCFGKIVSDFNEISGQEEYWIEQTKQEENKEEIIYKADKEYILREYDINFNEVFWKPSIFMPKKYARLHLVVTDVRIERLQDISIDDIIEEGFFIDDEDVKSPTENYPDRGILQIEREAKKWWKNLWNNINKKRGFGWSKNPFVVVYEFKKIDKSLAGRVKK